MKFVGKTMKVEDIERFNRKKDGENKSQKNFANRNHSNSPKREDIPFSSRHIKVQDIENLNKQKAEKKAEYREAQKAHLKKNKNHLKSLHPSKNRPSAKNEADNLATNASAQYSNSHKPNHLSAALVKQTPHSVSGSTQATPHRPRSRSIKDGIEIDEFSLVELDKEPSKLKKSIQNFFKRFGLLVFAMILILPLVSKVFSIRIPDTIWIFLIVLALYLMRFYARAIRQE